MTRPVRMFAVAAALAVMTTAGIGIVAGSVEAEAATQHTLRIPSAAFAPRYHATEFLNTGRNLQNVGASSKAFVAPVLLQGNSATIQSVQMHYTDIDSGAICVSVVRQTMKTHVDKTMSSMCSRNAVAGVRTRTDTTIQPESVSADQGVYVYVTLPPGLYVLHGVTIVYTSDP